MLLDSGIITAAKERVTARRHAILPDIIALMVITITVPSMLNLLAEVKPRDVLVQH